ncbi:hypothetical protein [Sandaracinus amylolyticus]|uniref:Lipoprotein n=1 Tax=Sandaracinus amylolyticus TaxID=927083 RepID=A0A0F6SGB1_9BACT|nr:hypothetical protein [Sandaracinus amylolyticus]AKF08384.1 hypothetical protein DB32_005533 [Sandaracinus amylolyticus]
MTRVALAIVALLFGACGTPCGDCGACYPPLQLRVSRAGGELLSPVMIEGADAHCGGGAGEAVCTVDELALGTHTLVVRTDGEAPVTLTVTLERDGGGCCSCGYQPIVREVVLGATGDSGV